MVIEHDATGIDSVVGTSEDYLRQQTHSSNNPRWLMMRTNEEMPKMMNEPISYQYCFNNNKHRKTLKSYTDIHSHCFTCIRPQKCIRMPASFNQAELSLEEKYSMILDVDYHNNDCSFYDNDKTKSNKTNVFDQINGKENESDAQDFCPVIRCTNDNCKMVMHYCKMREHFLLCQFQKVPCINVHYGCPFVLLRGQMFNHLSSHCPANVVHCSAEWNRWPLHSSEKSCQAQVFCSPHSLNANHLDVALALRDQRMLKQLWSASRQMKRIMRGRQTTHPAVPIKPYIGIRTFREFRNNNNTGAQQQKNPTDDPSSQSQFSNNNYCDNIDEEKLINYAAKLVEFAYHESLVEILRQTANYFRRIYYECSNDYRQSRKKSNSICQMLISSSLMNCQQSNNLLLPLSPGQSFPSSSSINLPIITDADKLLLAEIKNKKDNEAKKNLINCENLDSTNTILKHQKLPPPPPPIPNCNTLSLEIPIRSYAFHHSKPKTMYTFRCGMDFRKDELESHSLDIHSNIHGGLDGWIEHRCPLFQYGCTFVHRRMSPVMDGNDKLHTIVYNESLETFACKPLDHCDKQQQDLINGQIEMESDDRVSLASSLESDDLIVDNNHNELMKTSKNNSSCEAGGSNSSGDGANIPMTPSIPSLCSTYSLLLSNNSSAPLLMSPTSELNGTSLINTTSITTNTSRCSSRKSSHFYPQMCCSINQLPFEVLQNICKYLDGFSLNNLSFTSKSMRNVVQTFVKKKGYVVLQWKRFEMEKGKYQWRVVYKKWLFSTAMKPIKGWKLDSNNVMAEHLKICPFNDRLIHKEPFRLCYLNPKDFFSESSYKKISNHR